MDKINSRRSLIWLVILFFSLRSFYCHALERFTPATIDGDALAAEIKFPVGHHDVNRIVICSAYIYLNDKFRNFRCYFDAGDVAGSVVYERAIAQKIWDIEYTRAIADEKIKSVRFDFSVNFKRSNGQESISVHQNIGANKEKYGLTYIAPQRITNVKPTVSLNECRRDTGFWVKTAINIDGLPSDAKIVGGVGSDKCKSDLISQYLKFKFIPAQHDNKSVIADHLEYLECQRRKKQSCTLRSR